MNIQPDRNYPKVITFVTGTGIQLAFTLLTLCLTIFYNLAYFLYVPPTGVWLDYENQKRNSTIIYSLSPGGPGEKAGLQVGDKIVTIDGRTITNLNVPVHWPKRAGDVELYVVQRDGKTLTIPLQVESFTDPLNYLGNVLPVQLLSLFIYFFGLILLFFSPPVDIRARLVALIWILAGVALAATGPGYISCAWFAPNVAMISFGVSIFISIAAHLYFPVPTFSSRTRNSVIGVCFVLTALLVIAYLGEQTYFVILGQNPETSLLSSTIYYLFCLSWLVNIALLLKNRFFVKDKDIKRQTGIVFFGTVIGFLPFVLLSALPFLIFGSGSKFIIIPSNISILSLIFIPISYGYVIYQRKLLKIDLIVNRAIVLFLLILVILSASLTTLGFVSIFLDISAQMLVVAGSILCVLIALPSATLQKKLQIQVDRALYGCYYDYTTVTSDFSNHLALTIDRPALIGLLTNEIPEKMKIEKSALLLITNNTLELQCLDGHAFSVPLNDEICETLTHTQRPVRAQSLWSLVSPAAIERWDVFSWAQLFVPITHMDRLYGILVLGNRTTGDIYSNQDLQIVGTLGQQAALSLANIILVEMLRGLTQQLVRSDEEQRKRLVRDLHDSVLQKLFFVKQRFARSDSEAAALMDDTIALLRQTIKAQRPSLLDRGLILALQDLVEDMQELANEDVVILWHNHIEEPILLNDEKATSIYRIVQESLTNILKHAQADKAIVTVKRENGFLEIRVEDNGIGISPNGQTRPGHSYGLLGMRERATMIDANLNIASEPGRGTAVTVKIKL